MGMACSFDVFYKTRLVCVSVLQAVPGIVGYRKFKLKPGLIVRAAAGQIKYQIYRQSFSFLHPIDSTFNRPRL